MSSKESGASPTKESPDSILAPLTEDKIKKVSDAAIQAMLLQLRNLLVGILTTLLLAKDPEQKVVAAHLAEVNITVDDAKQLVADAETLMELLEDRDAKAAISQAATAKLDIARGRLHTEIQSYTGIIRSEIGSRSDALKGFGIKKLGAGRPGPRKSKKKTSGDTSGGSQDNSGTSQNNSGATPNSAKPKSNE